MRDEGSLDGCLGSFVAIEVRCVDVETDDMTGRAELDDAPIICRVVSPALPAIEQRTVRSELALEASGRLDWNTSDKLSRLVGGGEE